MIIFKQGLEAIATLYSIDQLLTYIKGNPEAAPYQTDADLPDFANNPGKFYYPKDAYPNSNPLQIGATRTYAKTTAKFSTGDVLDYSMCCLPTPPNRTADTMLYYQATIGGGVKVLVTSKTYEPGTGQYEFINDPNTLSLTLYTGTNRGVYGPVVPSGRTYVTAYDVEPLDYNAMLDEETIVSTLNDLFFNKDWVESYINQRLEVVIPQAVDEAVKQSEIVIS